MKPICNTFYCRIGGHLLIKSLTQLRGQKEREEERNVPCLLIMMLVHSINQTKTNCHIPEGLDDPIADGNTERFAISILLILKIILEFLEEFTKLSEY